MNHGDTETQRMENEVPGICPGMLPLQKWLGACLLVAAFRERLPERLLWEFTDRATRHVIGSRFPSPLPPMDNAITSSASLCLQRSGW
jgi:hypothetical protein